MHNKMMINYRCVIIPFLSSILTASFTKKECLNKIRFLLGQILLPSLFIGDEKLRAKCYFHAPKSPLLSLPDGSIPGGNLEFLTATQLNAEPNDFVDFFLKLNGCAKYDKLCSKSKFNLISSKFERFKSRRKKVSRPCFRLIRHL